MINNKNKRGISIMIGYILLVTGAIVMGSIVYQWMKTYVPADSLTCPEGISIYLSEFECSGTSLNITLKNNGRFNVAGYFIHGANQPDQELATIDLSSYFDIGQGIIVEHAVLFALSNENTLNINEDKTDRYIFNETIYSIAITPIIFSKDKNDKTRMVSCTNSRIKEELLC
ncbi:MAG: hypothetical protein QT05_C0048G0020 [archaeon GW2011_AR13]|nr:MAG: hypothetical protein QT05_C0048G0020 [archaeon GW2011_AR13]HIG94863.1 hypothetical protein [Nanoarchaeota archaeon]HIH63968.1 hypothetical protein [Nanoarchaeota archaeon]HIJ09690.1 hypothetical protein [Nanoarchaeota archaeon]